ncbi:MAG: hypothetical protein ACTSSA_15400 [Candidatus Freyarchaeota archaeon]
MGGGGPKVESPKPGPYEKELAKRLQRFAPYEEAFLREFAWSLPGAPGGPPAAPVATAATAPATSAVPTASADIWGKTFRWKPYDPEGLYSTSEYSIGQFKDDPEFQAYLSRYKGMSFTELLKERERMEEHWSSSPAQVAALEYLLGGGGMAVPSTSAPPPTPAAPTTAQAPSPTRPPTYLLAPYMESIEREYSKAREAISGMRPGGARERAMLELEAYWKPQAKTAATRALYEEARATLASLVGGGYGPTLRTLVGLEQQRSAMEYQQKAAAAQASAAQQASMWQSIGSLAGLGILKGFGLFG